MFVPLADAPFVPQEIYTGGNFTSVATISPRFGGVAGVPDGVVYPSNMSDCVRAAAITHGCYGGYGGCHNETSHHCIHPHCATPSTPSTMTFSSGKDIPAPADWMPPWSRVLPGGVGRDGPVPPPSDGCVFLPNVSLGGGLVPPHWGSVQLQWPSPPTAAAAQRICCGYCHADPNCVAAVLSGAVSQTVCTVFHAQVSSPLRHNNDSVGKVACIKDPTAAKTDDDGLGQSYAAIGPAIAWAAAATSVERFLTTATKSKRNPLFGQGWARAGAGSQHPCPPHANTRATGTAGSLGTCVHQPWEQHVTPFPSVMFNASWESPFRLYYAIQTKCSSVQSHGMECAADSCGIGIATSKDGLLWEKPQLDMCSFFKEKDEISWPTNNLLLCPAAANKSVNHAIWHKSFDCVSGARPCPSFAPKLRHPKGPACCLPTFSA